MTDPPPLSDPDPAAASSRRRWVRAAAIAAVVLGHALVLTLIALARPSLPPMDLPPPLNVILLAPSLPPPPPPPPPEPAPSSGGGRPSAPSVVRPPPDPPPTPAEITAPPTPAPEPTLVIGNAPVAAPTPGPGQGQQGTGSGTGSGDGDGPGVGGGPRFIQGPSQRDIIAAYPPAARAARMDGQVALRCRIRLDSRLEACRVVSETPAGQGFGEAAVQVALRHFRFRPPTRGGRPVADQSVTVGVNFGRPPPR